MRTIGTSEHVGSLCSVEEMVQRHFGDQTGHAVAAPGGWGPQVINLRSSRRRARAASKRSRARGKPPRSRPGRKVSTGSRQSRAGCARPRRAGCTRRGGRRRTTCWTRSTPSACTQFVGMRIRSERSK